MTIGGGEASSHPAFVLELIALCREAGIHVAVDTCGYTISEESFRVLREADLLLYDIKGADEKAHFRNTGVSNRPIWENLRKLDGEGVPTIVRMPVIPHHNDRAEELEAAAVFLSGLKNLRRVELICYHEFGREKYRQLGREYSMRENPFTPEEEQRFLLYFTRCGLQVRLGG